MPENPNQPRDDDAVLGGDSQPPTNAVVLGGLEGVNRRFASTVESQRILALNDALNYGSSGLDFVIQALQDESRGVKRAAYSLLLTKTETKAYIALEKFNHYQFFECLRTLEEHSNFVSSVAIAPERTLKANLAAVKSVAIAPDGKTIVSGSYDKTIKVWDLVTGKCLRTLKGHSNYVLCVAIAPDGKTIVSSSSDKTIKVWDILTGECKDTFSGHSITVNSVAITPDGRTIVSGGGDNTMKVWGMR